MIILIVLVHPPPATGKLKSFAFSPFLVGNSAPSSIREICCPRCERRARLRMGPASGTKEKTKVSEVAHPPRALTQNPAVVLSL